MKVLQIVGVNYKQGNGITVITDELIKTLLKNNIQSELLLLKPTKYEVPYNVYVCNDNFYSFFTKKHYDLVVFHGLFYKEYVKIGRILQKKNIPYVIKPHSSLMKISHRKSFLKKKIAFQLYLNSFINKSAALLFSNEEERLNSVFYEHKYYIETNGLNIDKTLKLNKPIDDDINLLFLSRLDFRHKGIDYLIAGYKKYVKKTNGKIAKLNIYGIGSKKQENRLAKLIKEVPSITFNGPAFGKEKEKVLENSDILMLTSRYEGFPTIFIDVLTRGIPVIVTPGTNAAYFEKEGIGWLSSLSSKSIAHTIERAVNDYIQNKSKIAQNCRNFAQNNFDIDKNIEITIQIYNDVLASIL
ncbi:glycosyltransferase [Draconibacterium orientale]|uniref:glycosyltransferase n=1 Tax=Draconibacterium orientale TaxID=1168034 RepID=UPI0029C05B02|nr:glycosyltransferase [Draconibacterium orientale]